MKSEKQKLFSQLAKEWGSENVVCHLYLARLYTDKYGQDPIGWLNLAEALAELAQYEEARSALRKAQRLGPDDKRYQHMVELQFGRMYALKGNLRLAEKWYRRSVGTHPTTVNLVFLGGCLARQGRYSEAKRCHRRAIRMASHTPDEAWFNLGLVLRAEGKHEKALECFDKAIELDPEYREAKDARKDLLKLTTLKKSSEHASGAGAEG